MSDKTNKLNIYLIKPDCAEPDDIIETSADDFDIDDVGIFYTEASHPHAPSWLKDFFRGALGEVSLLTSTSKGVLLVDVQHNDKKVWFAVVFGYGRSLLKEGVIEDRFGLKVVLNAVDYKSLRSIHKTTLGSVLPLPKPDLSASVIENPLIQVCRKASAFAFSCRYNVRLRILVAKA